MPVLLDTHVFLWWTEDNPKLSARARQTIIDSDCCLSLASCWEMAIKLSLEKIQFDRPLAQFLTEQLLASGVSLLPIDFRHIMRVARLPFHHRDPFDRLLAAQAIEERFSLISADPCYDSYPVQRIW